MKLICAIILLGDNMKDQTLFIIPDNIKEHVLLSCRDTLENKKIYTITQFIKQYFFDYNEKTIYYLMEKYNVKYDTALIYLNNIYYIEDKKYCSERINFLVSIKKELDNEALLIYNPLFKQKLKSTKIVFYNFEHINKFHSQLIGELKNITEVEIISESNKSEYQHNIYQLDNIDDEIEFVANKICELVLSGVDINRIVLLNVTDEYKIPLKRIFKVFKIPLNMDDNKSLVGTRICNFFIDNIEEDINNTLDKIKEQFDLNNKDSLNIYNKIINICNKYTWSDNYLDIKKLLIHDLKNTKIGNMKLKNAVDVVDLESYIPKDEDYVFLLDFNQGDIPVLAKDEDYISDNLKSELNLETTVEKNIISRNNILKKIRAIKNLIITHKKYGQTGEMFVSTLNDELSYQVITDNEVKYNYSNLNNMLKLGLFLDSYLKYGEIDNNLGMLFNNYKDNNYLKYDNKFTGVNTNYDELTLSYSSVDNYFKCAFKYYVNSILKLNIYEDNFTAYIGSLFHFILSKKEDNDLELMWKKFIDDNPRIFTNKELFFLEKLKSELKFILEVIESQKRYTNFDKEEYEKKIEIDKDGAKFIGIVDKILFNKDKSLGAIVDYKTGNPSLDIKYIEYGLGLQLPVYLYLINNAYPDTQIVGFYLQKILPSIINNNRINTLTEQKRSILKLQGYSISDESLLSELDKTYIDSQLIKSMKVGNNGFYAYSKTLTKNNMDKITNIVDKKITEAIEKIKSNQFEINPKKINNENIGCAFCKFKDICYMSEKDVVWLKEIKDLEFLGGDNNA